MANFQRHAWMTQVYKPKRVAPITAAGVVVTAPILTLQDQLVNTTTEQCVTVGPTTSLVCADAMATMQDLTVVGANMAITVVTAIKRWSFLAAQFLNSQITSGLII
jgi:hypothetical protein